MKTYTKDEIQSILDLHRKWLYAEEGGERAYLRGADLRGADLRGAYLRGAYLRGAYLQGADLQGADLRGAYLQGADLRGADLRGADLQDADLRGADLRGADLRGADLRGADLQDADLRGADLRGADLRGADLQGADLQDAHGGVYAAAVVSICPEGEIIGWKKAVVIEGDTERYCIVKLKIPADAKRSNASGRKCRASKAEVLAIEDNEGNAIEGVARSTHDHSFIYKVGETVEPTEPFDENRWNECAPGIHFFITREEAVAY